MDDREVLTLEGEAVVALVLLEEVPPYEIHNELISSKCYKELTG